MPSLRPLVACCVLGLVSCHRTADPGEAERAGKAGRGGAPLRVVEVIYEGGLKNDWVASGGSSRSGVDAGPASVTFAGGVGWTVSKSTLQHRSFGALVFRFRTEASDTPFLHLRLQSPDKSSLPRVRLRPDHVAAADGGWRRAVVPFSELNPNRVRFDGIEITATGAPQGPTLQLDGVGLTAADGVTAALDLGGGGTVKHLQVDCRAKATPISPLVYGIGYYALTDKEAGQWALGATGRRWGGNTTTRYNWQHGKAWNTGKDWFWENVETAPYTSFLEANEAHGVETALTIPMIGWVAKDTTSVSFPISEYGEQQHSDEKWRPQAGNGVDKSGRNLGPGSPGRTSIAAPPEFVAAWVRAIRERDKALGRRSVDIYMLDNEPALWHQTHRDVHPEPLTYDELLRRTLAYGSAIRAADPDARIAGPTAWGWPELFYSAKDSSVGLFLRPDRRAHGDVPLLPWYLRQLRDDEKRTGRRVLDLVDVHFYPQAEGIYGENGKVDPRSAALRIRSTRALWDRSYSDESYIKEPIYLLPRLHEWIDANYPGRGVVIGEWNFGAERHMSGGLATAEALGRFTQNRVAAAYYWSVPPAGSPAFQAFRAFRDFDGKKGHFLDYSLPTSAPESSSVFASRDAEGRHVVAVVLNLEPDQTIAAEIDLAGCGRIARRATFVYANASPDGFVAQSTTDGDGRLIRQSLAPYSITVLDIGLSEAIPVAVER